MSLIIFGFLSIAFTRGTLFLYRNGNNGFKLRRRGIVITATCTDIEALDGAFALRYQYEVDGTNYTSSSSPVSMASIMPGEPLAVTYDPRQPARSNATECVGKHRFLFLGLLVLLAPAAVAVCIFELLLLWAILFG
ncbi:DUF3592 domain-containing protein [Streptomyces sp. NPDC056656]|uniref:DUF3592 domain-containing protein n=1 Tax=Streptomyces sp. NPDC056656 TaxID=3345895 RepID=UPI0036C2E066